MKLETQQSWIEGELRATEHPELATDLTKRARLLGKKESYEEAEPLIRRALRIVEESYGASHTDAGTCLNNLATVLWNMKRPEDAEQAMVRAHQILIDFERISGRQHPDLPAVEENLRRLRAANKRNG